MTGPRERARWTAEFEEIGSERVRSEVMLGRWPADKRSHARQWLERKDVAAWQARADAGGGTGGLAKFRVSRRLLGAISGLIFGGFALFRILRQFKAGF